MNFVPHQIKTNQILNQMKKLNFSFKRHQVFLNKLRKACTRETSLDPLRRPPAPWVNAFEPPFQVGTLSSVRAVVAALGTLVDVDAGDQEEPEARRASRAVQASIVRLSR